MDPISTEPISFDDIEFDRHANEDVLVLRWRAEQLRRFGLPSLLALALAPEVDWHELADLHRRGCPLDLALEIVW
jgi:ribose 1,5-bisphosphokinase PhnN